MKAYYIEATVTISTGKRVLADSEKDAMAKASKLALPYVVSCSPDDDNFWDVGGELDGDVVVTSVEEADDE